MRMNRLTLSITLLSFMTLSVFAGDTGITALVDRHARAAGVPIALARAVVRIESNFNPRVTGRAVYLPADVGLEALLARRCDRRPAGSTIRFFASGMSCGGVIALMRDNLRYEVRVNWLTGGVEVVPAHRS